MAAVETTRGYSMELYQLVLREAVELTRGYSMELYQLVLREASVIGQQCTTGATL